MKFYLKTAFIATATLLPLGCSNDPTFSSKAAPKPKEQAKPLVNQDVVAEPKTLAAPKPQSTANAANPEVKTPSAPAPEPVRPQNVVVAAPPPPPPPMSSNQPFQACMSNGVASAQQPIGAKVYALPVGAGSLAADFGRGQFKTRTCMTHFDVPTRDFTEGFPGVPGLFEWFAIDARAILKIPVTGQYKFRLNSDDGSLLYINGQTIVNNDGQHSTKSAEGSVTLTAGQHKLRLVYFQGPATHIALQLFWTPPQKAESIIGTNNFLPDLTF